MKALVTGASSGIGRDMAIYLSKIGYEVILVARDKIKLNQVLSKLSTKGEILIADLRIKKDVDKVIKKSLDEKIDVLINNAGFGLYGSFYESDLDREIEMINVNVIAVHRLTKEVYKMMKNLNGGYILNVASSAGLMPGGPLLSTYYATKSYVRSLTLGLYEENRRNSSNVHLSILCPGPINTNFNEVAGTRFNLKSLSSDFVAEYAINKMFKNKLVIVPGFMVKCGLFFQRCLNVKMLLRIIYNIQVKKGSKN